MHVPYDVNTVVLFHTDLQEGSGFTEHLANPSNYYAGYRWQRGYGSPRQYGRGIFPAVIRTMRSLIPFAQKYILPHIAPIAKQALGALANQGVETGANIVSDLLKGNDPKETVVTHGTQGLKKLAKQAGDHLIAQAGTGRRKPNSVTNLHIVGRSVLASAAKKRRRVDKKTSIF